ncbi:porin family protein [Flavobacterium sp. 25HG05S-40]|uniref:porin family protein n=1 Tax=Flavobacterium sp. 25HG05S-40 TaxID=3458682 RepID=UPI004044C7E6
MKKLLFIAVVFVGAFTAQAQKTKFGVKAGVDFASIKFEVAGVSGTASETGFFVGGFATLGISEKFAVQPELLYVAISDSNFFSVPVLARYTFAEKFSALAGPSFNYFSDAEEDKLKMNLDLGATYDITEEIDVNVKYSLGFGDVAVNGIFIGAGYKF